MPRSAVITGLGAVSPLGVGMDALWAGLCEGRSALAPTTRFDASAFICKLAGEVKDFSAKDFVPKHYRKATKVMARDTELAVGAAKCAVDDAGLATRGTLAEGEGPTTYPGERMGCHIGAGLVAAETEELTSALSTSTDDAGRWSVRKWGEVGMSNLQPLWLLKYLPNMLACHVTIIHGAEGPSNTITCGDASGILSIGESCRVIERDAADLCFSGGAESKINLMGHIRTQFAGRSGETGAQADGSQLLRPYDPASIGIPGEAGGLVILEDAGSAAKRGARVYARVAGFGAGHSTRPPYITPAHRGGMTPTTNTGLRLAISRALKDAKADPAEIDVIVPQACGVPFEDAGELGALREVFGDRLAGIPMVTTSPNIGQCWAGTGALLAAVAARCLHEQTLPARIHAGNPATGALAGRTPTSKAPLRAALVCCGSLGGQNAALVLRAHR